MINLASALILSLVFVLGGHSRNIDDATINYGDSALYTTNDINKAVSVVISEFNTFDGCVLHSLSYAGDEKSKKELDYYNSVLEDKEYVSCIVLNSSFHSPENGGGAWEADAEYTWEWILVKESAGDWILLTYGHG